MQWVGPEELPHLQRIQKALPPRGSVLLQLRDGRAIEGRVKAISSGSNVREVRPPNAFYGSVELETEEGTQTVEFSEIEHVSIPPPKLLLRARG
ncbi:MAG TPA: hypothetical protein VF266_17685 [Thermoanaerobaculia bacterium]